MQIITSVRRLRRKITGSKMTILPFSKLRFSYRAPNFCLTSGVSSLFQFLNRIKPTIAGKDVRSTKKKYVIAVDSVFGLASSVKF